MELRFGGWNKGRSFKTPGSGIEEEVKNCEIGV
jgi:hypothetical protein